MLHGALRAFMHPFHYKSTQQVISCGRTDALEDQFNRGFFMNQVTYPCYWQKKDQSGNWYWIYYASNAKAIARSSESYTNRSDCTHSISLMKGSSLDAVFYDQ